MSTAASCIGLDWGTTRVRACRMDGAGRILERRTRPLGVKRLPRGAFEAALIEVVGDWIEADPDAPVIASGMVGGQHGWVEAPYLPCPVAPSELASRLLPVATRAAVRVFVVPGLTLDGQGGGVPDVMRGEETQLVGALDEAPRDESFVLPGTHSKWARVDAGRVTSIATFPSGELYELLSLHSTLGSRGMKLGRDHAGETTPDAFERGAALGLGDRPGLGGSLKRLFSARSLVARGELAADDASEYLSGLVLGSEVREAVECGDARGRVTLIGDDALCDRYERVLGWAGMPCGRGPTDAAARGQYRLARLAGLVGDA